MVETWNTASVTTSPYDGLWHNVTDNIFTTVMVGGGHFILLERTAPAEGSATAMSSDFWFGPIDVTQSGQAVTTVMTSSIEADTGSQQSLQLALIDQNQFSQTLTIDGVQITTNFKRL
jgi:hypothetical protein